MEAVSIKGTKNGLVIMLNPQADIEDIKSNLRTKMEKSKGFFKGAKYTLYSPENPNIKLDKSELEVICRQYGLIPSTDVTWPHENNNKPQQEYTDLGKNKTARVIPIRQQSCSQGENVLLIRRTLRSGQKISSSKSVVILGDVNPGAEVISENSIYVMGTCGGTIHAGVSDNLMSEVIALKYQPIVLRIGSITAEPHLSIESHGPVLATVNRGKVILKKY